jgi:hypothetical protein
VTGAEDAPIEVGTEDGIVMLLKRPPSGCDLRGKPVKGSSG